MLINPIPLAQTICPQNAEYIDILHKMSQALMDYETLDVDQIDDIMAGGDPRAPKSTEEPPSKDSKKSPVGDAAEQN